MYGCWRKGMGWGIGIAAHPKQTMEGIIRPQRAREHARGVRCVGGSVRQHWHHYCNRK
jgi:hypothetical protein